MTIIKLLVYIINKQVKGWLMNKRSKKSFGSSINAEMVYGGSTVEPSKPATITKKLWNKLKGDQKLEYLALTTMYEQELEQLSKIHNKTIAHNLALQTIWKQEKECNLI